MKTISPEMLATLNFPRSKIYQEKSLLNKTPNHQNKTPQCQERVTETPTGGRCVNRRSEALDALHHVRNTFERQKSTSILSTLDALKLAKQFPDPDHVLP